MINRAFRVARDIGILLTLLFLADTLPCGTQTGEGKIVAEVTDSAGNPINGATVGERGSTMALAYGYEGECTTNSSGAGVCSFEIEAGLYEVKAHKDGYHDNVQHVQVKPGQTSTVKFILIPYGQQIQPGVFPAWDGATNQPGLILAGMR